MNASKFTIHCIYICIIQPGDSAKLHFEDLLAFHWGPI